MPSEKEQFLQTWEQEHATTAKLIGAIPEGRLDFKPHARSWSTRELAWHLVDAERFLVEACLAGKIELQPGPPAPATLGEIRTIFGRQHKELVEKIRAAEDRQLGRSIQIHVAPKQMGDVPIMGVLWMGVVLHAAHHRGQLSVHLRMMDAKVPSIYGPSADEPWW